MLTAAVEPDLRVFRQQKGIGLKTGRDHEGRQERLHNLEASRGGSAASLFSGVVNEPSMPSN
jgi:hypothetical protein